MPDAARLLRAPNLAARELSAGRVRGVATSATSGVDGKFWEFLKYIYPTNHTWGSNMVTINLDVTDDLTVKGAAGQDGNSSLGVFYEKDY